MIEIQIGNAVPFGKSSKVPEDVRLLQLIEKDASKEAVEVRRA